MTNFFIDQAFFTLANLCLRIALLNAIESLGVMTSLYSIGFDNFSFSDILCGNFLHNRFVLHLKATLL